MHRGDAAVLRHAGLDAHERRVPAPVAVEDFLPCQADLDRPPRHAREVRDDDLVVEGVGLSAEAAAVGRRDDADPRGRHLEHLRERAVDVMRRLGRGPERELPVGTEIRQRRVLLERQVRVPFVEEEIVVDLLGARETHVRVAELHRDELVKVAGVAVVVDPRSGIGHGVLDRGDRTERLVLDHDRVERVEGGVLVHGRDGGDRVADETHRVGRERVLVLGDRQDAEGDRQIAARRRGDDAGPLQRFRHVHAQEARVRKLRAQDLAVQHPRKKEIVRELRLPRHLRRRVHLRVGTAHHASLRTFAHASRPKRLRSKVQSLRSGPWTLDLRPWTLDRPFRVMS